MLGDEALELAHQLRVPAQLQVGAQAILERQQSQLVQTRDLSLAERLIGQIGKRRTTPEGECVAQRPRGRRRLCRRACLGHQLLEPVQVELARPQPQLVARRARHEQPVLRGERLAKPRNSYRQRLRAVPRRGSAPQLVDQPVPRDDLIGVEQKQRQQRPLLCAPEGQLTAAVDRLQRPQDQKFHGQSPART